MLEYFPSSIFIEISLYLSPSQVYQTLASLNSDFYNLITSEAFKTCWLRSFLGISCTLSSDSLIDILSDCYENKILYYYPWKTNGGVSPNDFKNSYENMWTYSPEIYSTFYEQDPNLPLVKNVCCLAYFAGIYQEKEFSKFYDNDLYNLRVAPEGVPAKYKDFSVIDQQKMFSLDPLTIKKKTTVRQYALKLDFDSTFHHLVQKPQVSIDEDIGPFIPVIKKIAVARPLMCSGAVRSLVIIFLREKNAEDYSVFRQFDNIESFEDAMHVGNVINHINNEEFEFAEFEETNTLVYPAAWVLFKTWTVNNLLITLKRCHFAKYACVKLISIDDTTDVLGWQHVQQNFDITYTLMIGSILVNPNN